MERVITRIECCYGKEACEKERREAAAQREPDRARRRRTRGAILRRCRTGHRDDVSGDERRIGGAGRDRRPSGTEACTEGETRQRQAKEPSTQEALIPFPSTTARSRACGRTFAPFARGNGRRPATVAAGASRTSSPICPPTRSTTRPASTEPWISCPSAAGSTDGKPAAAGVRR